MNGIDVGDKTGSGNSVDEIIELYKRDVDVTLIDAGLRRSVAERLQALQDFERLRESLREAMGRG